MDVHQPFCTESSRSLSLLGQKQGRWLAPEPDAVAPLPCSRFMQSLAFGLIRLGASKATTWSQQFTCRLSTAATDLNLPEAVVAIIGSPNVGKSSLFNRLVKQRTALVANTPVSHVTRDYKEGQGQLGDLRFTVIDTSGLEPFMARDSIQARATQLTAALLTRCDIALLLLDARSGVLPADHELVSWLRSRTQATVLLAANKAERRKSDGSADVEDALIQATALGYGEPVAISAETGEGMVELYAALQPLVDEAAEHHAQSEGTSKQDTVKLAIIGIPNVGKSTLANHLLQRERSLTGPEPGLTRDTVRDSFEYEGQRVELADTAGWLKQAQIAAQSHLTKVTVGAQVQAERAYNAAHVAVLVVDAHHALANKLGLSRKEIALASRVVGEGRPVIVAINKLDTLPEAARSDVVKLVKYQMEEQLPEVDGVPCIGMSALTGVGAPALLPTVMRLYTVWNQRIPTARLNKWLLELTDKSRGTGAAAQALRVRYVTQVKSRPPTFALFVGGSEDFADTSIRMVRNSLRESFAFQGVPLRVLVRYKNRRKQ